MHSLIAKFFASLVLVLSTVPVFAWSHYSWSTTDNGVPVMVVTSGTERGRPNNGTVILLHGCSGPSAHGENFAGQLAGENFNAVIIDSWAYRGAKGGHTTASVCSTYAVKATDRLEEVYKVIDWVKTQPWHQGTINVLGWSHGGMVALAASKNGAKKGISKVVSFYPGCVNRFDYINPTVPTQIHIGKDDDWTPAFLCRSLYKGLFTDNPYGEIFEYEDAHHGFDGISGGTIPGIGHDGRVGPRTIRVNHDAKILSYARVFKFLKEKQ
jgi:dienelactone hydrolase